MLTPTADPFTAHPNLRAAMATATPTPDDLHVAALLLQGGGVSFDTEFDRVVAESRIAHALVAMRTLAVEGMRKLQHDQWLEAVDRLERMWELVGEARTTELWFALGHARRTANATAPAGERPC